MTPRSWRLSLSAQLWLMVTTAALLCGALIAVNLHFDQQRDRRGAADALRQHAKQQVAYIGEEVSPGNSTEDTLGKLSDAPELSRLGAPCQQALEGLQRGVDLGYLEVVDSTGQVLCSPQGTHQQGRPWAGQAEVIKAVADRRPFTGGPFADPFSHVLSVFTAVPLKTASARSLLYVSETQASFLPDDKDPSVESLMVDARTMTVVMRYPAPGAVVGTRLTDAALVRSVRTDGVTSSTGVDGVRRLYLSQPLGRSPYRLIVGESEERAYAAANSSLHRNLALGALLVVVVAGLGLLLQRQIGKPTRRLRKAIDAAAADASVVAPESGPAELAALGASFNAMLGARREHEAELAHRALHDPLTRLPNRTALTARLDELIAEGRPCAAVFLDLDRFKLVNDSHGHAVGDELLVSLAGRLLDAVRPDDVVGRFGGDEFVIAVPDIASNAAAVELADRVRQVMVAPVRVAGRELFVSGSVGIAIRGGGEDAQAVLRNADTAMYKAKARGRNRAELFDDAMREEAVHQLRTQGDLHRALEREQLSVLYQPLVELADGSVLGAEALVRWQHPEHGLISPAEFIPVAEDTGLVVPIGAWVLREACSWAVRSAGVAGRPVTVAVNVSSRQLGHADFLEVVEDALTTTGLAPHLLCLEVTESVLVEDSDLVSALLTGLRARGVRVALDDFGTGWSSLTYLQQLPVDEIKLDRSFVSRVTEDTSAATIVASLVGMAEALGLEVTAEGIETPDQLAFLQPLGRLRGQGYLFARPLPATEATAVMAAGSTPVARQGRMDV